MLCRKFRGSRVFGMKEWMVCMVSTTENTKGHLIETRSYTYSCGSYFCDKLKIYCKVVSRVWKHKSLTIRSLQKKKKKNDGYPTLFIYFNIVNIISKYCLKLLNNHYRKL